MKRALSIAKNGMGRVSPNPMVGAVIVHNDRIIGEGFHSFYGGPHAEVNAIKSVKPQDRHLLKESTIYVTLEPCAHFGKTPPCANLIVDTGIPKAVIGMNDPNPKVAGKGLKILEDAGVKITTGILENECRALNPDFIKAHTSDRVRVTLKWAQSADGFMASFDDNRNPEPVKFSSELSSVWMHRLRSGADAILVGKNTEKIDNPLLTNRLWGGNSPEKFVADRHIDPLEFCKELRLKGYNSLIVEGGPTLLKSFIKDNVWDEIRLEISPIVIGNGLKAPAIPETTLMTDKFFCRENLIEFFSNPTPHP